LPPIAIGVWRIVVRPLDIIHRLLEEVAHRRDAVIVVSACAGGRAASSPGVRLDPGTEWGVLVAAGSAAPADALDTARLR
jgi:hypothetical protein